jgi:hypothetical protein
MDVFWRTPSGPENLFDSLAKMGSYTSVYDTTGGRQHDVSYSKGLHRASLLENKLSLIAGEAHGTECLQKYTNIGLIPPGGLAFPQYKVASLSLTTEDAELHALGFTQHFGARQRDESWELASPS